MAIGSLSILADTSTTNLRIPERTTEDFYVAIEKNDAKFVQQFLSDTKRATQEFLSYHLLDYALELDRDQIAQLLVEAGAGVDTLAPVRHDNLQILEEMLKRGVEPRGASLAAELGNVTMVNMLLNAGESDLTTEGTVRNGRLEILQLLLTHGAEPDGLEIAILHGHEEVATLLLESGADPNEITRMSKRDREEFNFAPNYASAYLTPLHYAVLNKSLDLVTALLKAGADPNIVPIAIRVQENTSVENAWPTVLQTAQDPVWGDEAIAQLLEKNGAILNVSDIDEKAQLELELYRAAEEWNYKEVNRLLDLGAKPIGFGSFYYDRSVRYKPKIMQVFVEAGADPNIFSAEFGLNTTPAVLALMNGDVDNFKRFVQAGAETDEGFLSVYRKIVLTTSRRDPLELMWSFEDERNYVDIKGPIRYGLVQIVEATLMMGARPVGLRSAVTAGMETIVKLLLEAGADPNQTAEQDERALLELAVESENQKIVAMLREAGARE